MGIHNSFNTGYVGKLGKAWDNYWFYPAPLFNLAVSRIVIVGFQLYYLFAKRYGRNLLTQADIPGRAFEPLLAVKALNALFPWEMPPTFFLVAVFWVAIVSGVTALLGLKTRLSLLLFALSNLYAQAYLYSFGSFHHGEAIMLIVLFLFALAPSGGVLSLDSWLRQGRSRDSGLMGEGEKGKGAVGRLAESLRPVSVYARWPLLVTQWLFSIIYLSAAVNKVNADGAGLFSAEWMNGYTLQHYLLRDGLQWGSDLGVWLGQFHVPAIISSWFAVLFEATFWLVLPFPKLIWFFIPLGYALHIGIWMAQRAPFFHYLALYVVFIPWTAVVKVVANRLGWPMHENPTEISRRKIAVSPLIDAER